MKKLPFLLCMALFLLLFPAVSFAQMSSSEIETIQKVIDEKGLSWTAGENSITRMTDEQRRAMLGGLPELPGTPERPREGVGALDGLPANFSWGDKDGHNWMTSVKNQGGCGSCWAFAASGAFETSFRIDSDNPSLVIDIAEQNMVSCWKGDCVGTTMSWTLGQFQSNGSPDEACFPYVSGSGYVPSCANRCADWLSRAFFVENRGNWYNPSITIMKNEIQGSGPIPVWMMVYTDFWYYGGGVYEHATGGEEGGHFVVLYGWDDANNCWLGKNSWGTSWGEIGPDGTSGWFRIRMGTNEARCEEWVYWLDPLIPPSCCVDLAGNVNCDPEDITDIGDLTRLIDFLFISYDSLCCPEEANTNGSLDGIADIGDITSLIDYLFISNTLPEPCL